MIKTYLDNAEELIKASEGNRKFCNEIFLVLYKCPATTPPKLHQRVATL